MKGSVAKMPRGNVYSQHLGPTLKAKFEQIINSPHHKQVSLYEELALARIQCEQAVALAAPCLEGKITKESTRIAALELLRDSVNHVKDLTLAASRLEHETQAKVSLRVVDLFIVQIMTVIARVVPDKAAMLKEAIDAEVRLPHIDQRGSLVEGTNRTPDQVVAEMDDTVG